MIPDTKIIADALAQWRMEIVHTAVCRGQYDQAISMEERLSELEAMFRNGELKVVRND